MIDARGDFAQWEAELDDETRLAWLAFEFACPVGTEGGTR
jgi:hypothetical protein